MSFAPDRKGPTTTAAIFSGGAVRKGSPTGPAIIHKRVADSGGHAGDASATAISRPTVPGPLIPAVSSGETS